MHFIERREQFWDKFVVVVFYGVQFLSEAGKITAKAGACENSQNKVKPSAGSMLMIASFAIVLQLQLSH